MPAVAGRGWQPEIVTLRFSAYGLLLAEAHSPRSPGNTLIDPVAECHCRRPADAVLIERLGMNLGGPEIVIILFVLLGVLPQLAVIIDVARLPKVAAAARG